MRKWINPFDLTLAGQHFNLMELKSRNEGGRKNDVTTNEGDEGINS